MERATLLAMASQTLWRERPPPLLRAAALAAFSCSARVRSAASTRASSSAFAFSIS